MDLTMYNTKIKIIVLGLQTKDVCAEVILLNFANCWELLLDIVVYLRIFLTFWQSLRKNYETNYWNDF